MLQQLLWLPVRQRVLFKITGCSLESLLRTSQTTVAFCRTLVIAHCGPIPMTCGSCLCCEYITNSVIGVSWPLVVDCGTTFHPDYSSRDLFSTPLDISENSLIWRPEHLVTIEFIGAIEIGLSIYLFIRSCGLFLSMFRGLYVRISVGHNRLLC